MNIAVHQALGLVDRFDDLSRPAPVLLLKKRVASVGFFEYLFAEQVPVKVLQLFFVTDLMELPDEPRISKDIVVNIFFRSEDLPKGSGMDELHQCGDLSVILGISEGERRGNTDDQGVLLRDPSFDDIVIVRLILERLRDDLIGQPVNNAVRAFVDLLAASQVDLRELIGPLHVFIESLDLEQHHAVGVEIPQPELLPGLFQIRQNTDAFHIYPRQRTAVKYDRNIAVSLVKELCILSEDTVPHTCELAGKMTYIRPVVKFLHIIVIGEVPARAETQVVGHKVPEFGIREKLVHITGCQALLTRSYAAIFIFGCIPGARQAEPHEHICTHEHRYFAAAGRKELRRINDILNESGELFHLKAL